jgi:hypothetical protein
MAHRIAELMQRADEAENEDERDEARRECADLILRVWSRRSGWPYGQPLAKLAPALEKLAAEPDPYGRPPREPEECSWAGVFALLDELHKKERRVHQDAALAEFSPDESKSWLEEHGDDMSEEEADTLSRLVQMIESTRDEHFHLGDKPVPNFGALPDEERTKLVLEALDEIDVERQRLRRLASSKAEFDKEDADDEQVAE